MNKISQSDLDAASNLKILQNRGYNIMTKINEGTYAKVYLGEFLSPTKGTFKLAVKTIETKYNHPDVNKKFLPRELNILSQIEHPHIIHIHSILKINVTFYIFMRYAERGDLFEFISTYGTINETVARVWSRQIALALQYLHEMNIAHRDIKCENILITANYNVKLSDFGFARITLDPKHNQLLSETYCGTLLYVPPEILQGRPYNPKIADIWSVGVVIYVMLNKALPYTDNNAKVLYENQMKRNFKFRTKVTDSLSKEVKLLIENLLDPEPINRPSIEKVINSDWIMMDKRLTTLSSMEQAALLTAYEPHPLLGDVSLLKLQLKPVNRKQEEPDIVDEIRPYNDTNEIRESENTNKEEFKQQSTILSAE